MNLDNLLKDIWPNKKSILTYRGTTSLIVILEWIKNKHGVGEIVIPSTICPSLPLAVKLSGFTIRFCDSELDTFCPSWTTIQGCLTKQTRAVLVPHLFGKLAEIKKIFFELKKINIYTIEDLAHAPLSMMDGSTRVGTYSDFSLLSFSSVKMLTGGGGGLLISQELYDDEFEKIHECLPLPLSLEIKVNLENTFIKETKESFYRCRIEGKVEQLNIEKFSSLFKVRYIKSDDISEYNIMKSINCFDIERRIRRLNYLEYVKRLHKDIKYSRFRDFEIPWRLPLILDYSLDQQEIVAKLRKFGLLVSDHYHSTAPLFGEKCPLNSKIISQYAINLWVDNKVTLAQITYICNFLNKVRYQ